MTRTDAYSLLTKHLHNPNLLKHCLACEAAMKGVYHKVTPQEKQNEEDGARWGITGLLHDVDYEIAQRENRLAQHGLLIFEIEKGIPGDIAQAIKSHNFENTGVQPQSEMDWAITCVDQLTGLIVACALIHPERKLSPLTVDFIKNRMKEKSFAKGAKREPILLSEEKLGLKLDDFIAVVLTSMQKIHKDLSL